MKTILLFLLVAIVAFLGTGCAIGPKWPDYVLERNRATKEFLGQYGVTSHVSGIGASQLPGYIAPKKEITLISNGWNVREKVRTKESYPFQSVQVGSMMANNVAVVDVGITNEFNVIPWVPVGQVIADGQGDILGNAGTITGPRNMFFSPTPKTTRNIRLNK